MTDETGQEMYAVADAGISGGIEATTGRPVDSASQGLAEFMRQSQRENQWSAEMIDQEKQRVHKVLDNTLLRLGMQAYSVKPQVSPNVGPSLLVDFNYDLVSLPNYQTRRDVRQALAGSRYVNTVWSSTSFNPASSADMTPGLFYLPLEIELPDSSPKNDDALMEALKRVPESQLAELFTRALTSERARDLIAQTKDKIFPEKEPFPMPVQTNTGPEVVQGSVVTAITDSPAAEVIPSAPDKTSPKEVVGQVLVPGGTAEPVLAQTGVEVVAKSVAAVMAPGEGRDQDEQQPSSRESELSQEDYLDNIREAVSRDLLGGSEKVAVANYLKLDLESQDELWNNIPEGGRYGYTPQRLAGIMLIAISNWFQEGTRSASGFEANQEIVGAAEIPRLSLELSSILEDVLVQEYGRKKGEIDVRRMDSQIQMLREVDIAAISQEYAGFAPNIRRIFFEAFKGSQLWSVLEGKFSQADDDEMTRHF